MKNMKEKNEIFSIVVLFEKFKNLQTGSLLLSCLEMNIVSALLDFRKKCEQRR
jgi:hypothetical protein